MKNIFLATIFAEALMMKRLFKQSMIAIVSVMDSIPA